MCNESHVQLGSGGFVNLCRSKSYCVRSLRMIRWTPSQDDMDEKELASEAVHLFSLLN